MKYQQIRPKKIYEEVAEAIQKMIREGVLKPGDKLDSVQQLAENFQVGRSAIREALSALRAMGLIEMKQGEGTYVNKGFGADQISSPLSSAILMNEKDIAHLLEVREIIETGAAPLAAQNRTEENLEAMWEALEEMKRANGDEELGEKADLTFHLAIVKATQNPLLFSLLSHISELMQETMRETRRLWLFSKQTTLEQLYKEHDQIFVAITEKNEDAARIAMINHLKNVESILENHFKEQKNT